VWWVESHSQRQVTTPDVALAELAARQHGVVALAQLLALGFGAGAGAIAYRVKVGRLHLLHRGVYAVGHRPPSPLATAMAAVLACGPDAALSHRSAGALWRILPRWHTPTEVTTPTKRGHPGVHVHRSRHTDATTHYGIRVTTPARTLVDLADVLTPKQLTRALNEAQVQRLITPAELATLLTRYPGRRTAQLTPERGATRSTLEDDFVRFLKRHRLPLPELNQTSPATKSTPSTATTDSSSNSTAASSTPPPMPSNKTATETPTSSMRGSPPSASPTTASSTTARRRPTGSRRSCAAAPRATADTRRTRASRRSPRGRRARPGARCGWPRAPSRSSRTRLSGPPRRPSSQG
jgi:hypothetical protein